jgi:hypothetical protein
MLYALIGPDRDKYLKMLNESKVALNTKSRPLVIPNLTCHPYFVDVFLHSIDEYRNEDSEKDVWLTTDCASVIDALMPTEIYIVNSNAVAKEAIKDMYGVMEAYDTGIQHLSEILRTRGLWNA